MEILHVSAECYPASKAGGLADVVGALPKYQNKLGHTAKVVTPMHRTKFLYDNDFEVVHKGDIKMGDLWFPYTIIKEKTNKLDFDFYMVDINGLLDREKIYGYSDDIERFFAFQIAVVDWISKWKHAPGVIHVHDHHTAFIPFMIQYCYAYQHLKSIRTVFTIHNGQYQGWMPWTKVSYMPAWNSAYWGKLDWNKDLNPMASAIKCAWKVTTVSYSYLEELRYNSKGLEALFEYEKGKCTGILNGIDTAVWDPETDSYLDKNFSLKNYQQGKDENKKILCEKFNLDFDKPLFIFIGRLVHEKAADLLPQVINDSIYHMKGQMNFLLLGSGDYHVERHLENMRSEFVGYYNSQIGYNEKLSHEMYAGGDFLLMPSRVEPCGLNQMYAMRYGTVPIVRNTGGLRDTVIDYGDVGGYGVKFNQASVWDVTYSIHRALDLYKQPKRLHEVRTTMMKLDNSWENSASKYIELYQQIIH
ncbi:glycogen synthase [Ferruginibacter albus]|uniref:glycogen synthase n=1 Tax=Ferruginibacter albus TaxID=2875540 RepID=UPI001CC4063E|nr:glycogen/starch synthase [Ferruginibacter albus]UAY53583.1 glycogen/starch synthase [Ferruginibacter albus]